MVDLDKYINDKRDIVIAGYCPSGKYLKNLIRHRNQNCLIIFCDNAVVKQGRDEENIIMSFEKAVTVYRDAVFLIASPMSGRAMKKQLLDLGVESNNIVYEEIKELLLEMMNKYSEKRRLTPQKYLRMEISLAEHCNLNCKYCSHFSSIAEKEFLDIHEYKKDMQRMSELLDGKSDKIYLLGGEPLLYADIIRCMEITRECFKQSRIILLTNGLLIPKMSSEFWETCRKRKIVVEVTRYPIGFNYEAVIDILQDEQVEFEYMRDSDITCTFDKYPLDLDGKQDSYYSFTHCSMANQCHLLKKGKIYTCSVIGCIEHFNKKFGYTLAVTENDYVDIYKVKNGEELLEKLARPADFCRYCNVKGRIPNLPFEISKREIQEWI